MMMEEQYRSTARASHSHAAAGEHMTETVIPNNLHFMSRVITKCCILNTMHKTKNK